MAEIAGLTCKTEQEIEQARVRLLGKKGEITALFDEFRTVAPELKREFGQKLNVLKNTAAAKIEELKEAAAESPASSAAAFDYTMPGDPAPLGSRHPVSIAREEIVGIFNFCPWERRARIACSRWYRDMLTGEDLRLEDVTLPGYGFFWAKAI